MGINVVVKSYRKEVEKKIDDDLTKKMERVGLIVENQAKENVNQLPPEHPQVQTGQLRSSITHEVENTKDEHIALIGTPVKHGLYLELGTINMPAYSWLMPAVEMSRDKIKDTLKTDIKAELSY